MIGLFRLDRLGPVPIIRFEALGTIFAYGAAPASANGQALTPLFATDRRCRSRNPRPLPQQAAEEADLSAARRVLRFAGEALGALSDQLDGVFSRSCGYPARRARAGRRQRHGQERPCRPQDRRDPVLHRHAGPVRPSRRGQPWRPRRADPRGCAADAVLFRRDGRTLRSHHLRQALRHSADRHGRQCRIRRCSRRPMWRLSCPRRRKPAPWGSRRPPRPR